jgi:uncharacterized protein DUF4410
MKTNPALSLCVIAALGLQALFSAGCASGYTRPPVAGLTPASSKVSTQNQINRVDVELTPEVKERLKDSLKFDAEALVGKVDMALSNHALLNKEKKENILALHITVTHVRVRNTFNAVMWGFMSGNDSIQGDIIVKDSSGGTLDRFHVDTSYALGGWAGGQDSMRMNWLYEAFAKQVVSGLTGEPKKD